MTLREAFGSQSTMDIIFATRAGADVKDKKAAVSKAKAKYKPVDRSQQGAALSGQPNLPLDNAESVVVSSDTAPRMARPDAPPAQKARTVMVLTLKGLNAKKTTAIYAGTPGTVRISLSAFPGKTAPDAIEVAEGVFAVKASRAPKVRLTKEQRAALPKPTEAEKIAKMEQRLAAARAKLAKQNEAATDL